jgi:hypothetical protein
MSISYQLIEQMCAARDKLVRAIDEYDARIARAGISHFSDTARAIRKQLRLDVLLTELEHHLAKLERVRLRRDAPLIDASSYSRSETDLLH